jgi:Pyruvate/2-oxoacid:ferredoxin oxidoreductase delta subunit
MKRAIVDPAKCAACSPCPVIEGCPMEAAFREEESDKPWIDFYRCSGCMKCMVNCPREAVAEISHPCDGKPRMGW